MIKKLQEIAQFYRNIKFNKIKSNENILIFGISRGGTTMLAEALIKVIDSRLAWEPLFPHRQVQFSYINPFSIQNYSKLDLGWNPFIDESYTAGNDYFDKLFSLEERNIRLFRYTDTKRFSKQKYTIFKFCFGNFMYKYFQDRYGFKSIILLRHPFAVAASSLKFGENYDWHKKNWANWKYEENELNTDFFKTYNSHLNLIKSPFTLLVFQAVTQFSYALKNSNPSTTTIVFYEDIVLYPTKVLNDLEKILEKKLDSQCFLQSISKGSFSSKEGHTLSDSRKQLSKWKQLCSEKDIEDGLEIFKAFKFDFYSENIQPVLKVS